MTYNVKMGWSKAEAKQLWKTYLKYDYYRQHPDVEWKDLEVTDDGQVQLKEPK